MAERFRLSLRSIGIMLEYYLLFFVSQYLIHYAQAGSVVLGKIPFDGPIRGPDLDIGDEGRQSQSAKQQYVEHINYLQEDVAMRWPLGVVPYYFDLKAYDYLMNSRVREAMDVIEAASCVRFTPVIIKPDNYSWLHITNPDRVRDCVHSPIYKGNQVMVILGLDCLQRRDMVHALLHGIGFGDEVTHPQRDQYIRILWDNIQAQYKSLFHMKTENGPSKFLVEYDPMSIMHFHDRAFSRNGYATIAGLLPGLQIAPSETLSHLDKMKLRLIFGHECNRRSVDDLMDTCQREMQGGKTPDAPDSSEEGNKKYSGEVSSKEDDPNVPDGPNETGSSEETLKDEEETAKEGTGVTKATPKPAEHVPDNSIEVADTKLSDNDYVGKDEVVSGKEHDDIGKRAAILDSLAQPLRTGKSNNKLAAQKTKGNVPGVQLDQGANNQLGNSIVQAKNNQDDDLKDEISRKGRSQKNVQKSGARRARTF